MPKYSLLPFFICVPCAIVVIFTNYAGEDVKKELKFDTITAYFIPNNNYQKMDPLSDIELIDTKSDPVSAQVVGKMLTYKYRLKNNTELIVEFEPNKHYNPLVDVQVIKKIAPITLVQ